MSQSVVTRHNNIAISLHWLMAFLIIGMLIVGKYLHHLDKADPLRFTLTQWHKTFGVLILILAVFRLAWRLAHRVPTHPPNAPAWERVAANASHFFMYALIFIAPMTGWMMVSASPLNIDTYLFNVVPWPHIPWLQNLDNKESAEALFLQLHVVSTGALIALLLLHVGAALKHHLIDKDTVLVRMLPAKAAGTYKTMLTLVTALALGVAVAVVGYSQLGSSGKTLSAGSSAVQAIAIVSGDSVEINFTESTVTASIDDTTPEKSTLQATVNTASATSSNLQVSGPLPDADWFDSNNHPTAQFASTSFKSIGDGRFEVSGVLNIKGIDHTHTFDLNITDADGEKTATGEFSVDRTAYELGLQSQPNDDYVNNQVTIAFEFSLAE